MKKVLFATTALVASAGIAAADITLSGSAQMGIKGGDRYYKEVKDQSGELTRVPNDKAQFHTDFTLEFVGSGETENGLTFGFNVELDAGTTETSHQKWKDENGEIRTRGLDVDNEFVFISGAFGTLTLGEIDGAFDRVMKEVNLAGGSIADDETEHAGFNGNSGFDGSHDDQILRYDYAFGDFGFSVSYEQAGINGASVKQDDNIGVGVSYTTNVNGVDLYTSLAYQEGSRLFKAEDGGNDKYVNGNVWGLSLAADFGNGFQAGLNYSSYDFKSTDIGGAPVDADYDHYAIGIAYEIDAWTFAANWGKYNYKDAPNEDGYGLVVNYDLGGGAVIQAGYGNGESIESWSFGVAMSF